MGKRSIMAAACAAIAVTAVVATLAADDRGDERGDDGGVDWPRGQLLPQFASVRSLDVVDVADRSDDERLLFGTLQGVVNRERPRVYLIEDGDVSTARWPSTFTVPQRRVADPWTLVEYYRDELRGTVVYDPAQPDSINVATTLAGLHDAVVASPQLAERLAAAPYELPVLRDLRGRFGSRIDAYRWQYEHLWQRTTHRMLIGARPYTTDAPTSATPNDAPRYGLRDYAVANRAMAVWLDPNVPEERELFERMLADMPENSAYVGWFAQDVEGENSGVELVSRHAKLVVPADWASSLTVHSAAERLAPDPPAPRAPRLEDKTYVSFFMTEGDNLQYNQHRLRALWDDPARGTVPISWSTSPLMLDAGRHMLNHYLRTATPNDYLLAGPTGAGYVFPEPFPDDSFSRFARVSGEYMRAAGLTSLYGLNREAGADAALSPADARAVVEHMRPEGVVLNLFFDRTVEHGHLPRGTPLTTGPIATTVEQGEAQVRDAIADCAGRRPCFVTLGVLSWSMGPTQLAEIAASLGADVEVVRGDHYFELMRRAAGEHSDD